MTHNKPIPYNLGQQYWISDGDRFFSPQALSSLGLPEYVDRIDDVFVWGKNEKTYFFYKNLYWRYNEVTKVCIKLYIGYIIQLRISSCSLSLRNSTELMLNSPYETQNMIDKTTQQM